MTTNRSALESSSAEDGGQRGHAARRLWRAQTAYLVGLTAFAILALFAHLNSYFGWDLEAARALQALPVPGLSLLMRAASIAGNTWKPWALSAVTAAVLLVYRRRSEAFGLILSVGGGELANYLIKVTVARPRPAQDLVAVYRQLKTNSFPSGHVTFYVCYFGFLFFVADALLPRGSWARRGALALTAIPVALVGLSRVYLGEHWPSDVIGSYLFSAVWLGFSLWMYRRWKERATFHRAPPEHGVASTEGKSQAD